MSSRVQAVISTPIGDLRLVADESALWAIDIGLGEPSPHQNLPQAQSNGLLSLAASELLEFFSGRRRAFTTPLAPEGTEFQRSVWEALLAIPYGETCSYSHVATAIGRPRAVRAVGAANGRNPIPIMVPCHRVIGANGDLTGYGGGLEAKRWLLAHERNVVGAADRSALL